MKKLLAVLVTVTMLLSAVGVLAFTVSADGTYTVIVAEQAGFTTENYSATNSPVVFAGGSAATDAVVSATCSYLVEVSAASETAVRKYTLIVDGTEHAAWIQANYNAGSNRSTVFITLPEGTYSEVIARGTDEEGVQMDVLKFTNITVTAAENTVPDDKEVEFTPCWTLTPSALAQGSSLNAVTVTENDFGYVTFTAGQTGDPYLNYIGGTSTKVGRWLLVKYNNHSVIPRMQLYMAQGAGITSDNNMIEFPIAANGSGWTYVIVDMATNQFYDKENQTVQHFRFDPLEARNWSGGSYQFTGEEAIDVAYIMGFTTKAGLMGYLEANELHDVTKTAVLQESQVTVAGDKATYTDENGVTWDVTKNEDGTYSYTYEKKDVRIPCDTTPKLLLAGSRLKVDANSATLEMDPLTGITTINVTGGDPNATYFNESKTAARYMAIRYRTSVQDNMEVFLSSSDAAPAAGQSFKRELAADGAWHTDIIDLSTVGVSTLNTDTYELKFLRVDFFDAASSGTMELEFIAFFDSEDAAYQYMHTYKTYTATFMANGKVVDRVVFEAGTTSIKEPAVPEKAGFTGKWKAYTLSDKNITIMAEYTMIAQPTTEPATTVAEPTDTEAPPPATGDTPTSAQTTAVTEAEPGVSDTGKVTGTNATTSAAGSSAGGCKSVLGGLSVLLIAAGAALTLAKRKHS